MAADLWFEDLHRGGDALLARGARPVSYTHLTLPTM